MDSPGRTLLAGKRSPGGRMSHSQLGATVDRLKSTASLEEIMEVMRTAFAALSLNNWVYACQMLETYVTAPVFVFMNTSLSWIERYLDMGYHQVDPIVRYYSDNNLPWIWKTADDWSPYGEDAVEFMADVSRHDYAGGLCIPLFSAQNTRGFINFVSQDSSLSDLHEALEGRAAQAVFLLRYVQEEIFRVALPAGDNLYHNPLSARQKEILLWVGEGLTAKGVAQKLGISYRTVESYLEEIQRKLRVANRQQAVSRAISLGYILPLNTYQAPRDRAVRLVLPCRDTDEIVC
jgi:DNA-binding CsgD family transcriptional regulator